MKNNIFRDEIKLSNAERKAFACLTRRKLTKGEYVWADYHMRRVRERTGLNTQVEQECLEAVRAVERALSEQRCKPVRATRTWQMIKRHGIIGTVERLVKRRQASYGYRTLINAGLQQYTFEEVVLRHPQFFSAEAFKRSRQRLSVKYHAAA